MTAIRCFGNVTVTEPVYKLLKDYSEAAGYSTVEDFISDLCTAKAMTLIGLGDSSIG